MASTVKIKQFKNKKKEPVAGLTPEHAIYDANGVRLDAKLGNVNLQEFRDLQQQCVNKIKEQQNASETYINNKVQSAKAEIDRKHEETAQLSQASLVGTTNTTGLSGNNVQENLNNAGTKLSELETEVIYDVTANNDGATFASLSALLSSESLSTLIPISVRNGGMTIRFIQGSVQDSDNKYIQARCMAQLFSTDVTQWQCVDDEPTTGSQNLVKSGGVFSSISEETTRAKAAEETFSRALNTINITFENVTNGALYECVLNANREYIIKNAGTGKLTLMVCNNSSGSDQEKVADLGEGGSYTWTPTKDYKYVRTFVAGEVNVEITSLSEVDKKLSAKVDKETGKGLSTNDYTNEDKDKLSGLGSQINGVFIDVSDLKGWSYYRVNIKANTQYEFTNTGNAAITINLAKSSSGSEQIKVYDLGAGLSYKYIPTDNFTYVRVYAAQGAGLLMKNSDNIINNIDSLLKKSPVFYVGTTKEFKTLKSITEYIKNNNIFNAKVYVDAETFDLVEEYGKDWLDAFVPSSNLQKSIGLMIGNNTHFIFSAGSKVVFDYDATNQKTAMWFSPFNVYGSFILENANIECVNCRYCVHEDIVTAIPYSRYEGHYEAKYINCVMYHKTNTFTPNDGITSFGSCIGAGTMPNSYSLIEGGEYRSSSANIGYHNYSSSMFALGYSKVEARNVWLGNKFHFSIYANGDSDVNVEVSNCRFNKYGALTVPDTHFSLKAWNNYVDPT